MLGTIAFFIVDFFVTKDKEKKKEIFKTTVLVGIACIVAFIVAICIHGRIKGNGNIIEGIKMIYKDDVLRRTILSSDEVEFPKGYTASLEASVGETVAKYFTWESDIILGIKGKYFMLFFISSLAITIYNVLKQNKNCYRDLAMFGMFLITTLSWIVLGKAHSYVHSFINFILWYFGFIQICLYIIVKFICQKTYEYGYEIEKGEKDI